MKNIVKISYNDVSHEVKITINDADFDVSRIEGKDIQEWAFPFVERGIRWFGLYDEIIAAIGKDEEIWVQFDGNDANLKIVKDAFKHTNVKVAGLNNRVVILYSNETLNTKITANGKVFDTSKLQNRYIEEWVKPFKVANFEWKGIFEELNEFIGSEIYSIQFAGNQSDMKMLIDNCPDKVNISYKPPVIQKSNPVGEQKNTFPAQKLSIQQNQYSNMTENVENNMRNGFVSASSVNNPAGISSYQNVNDNGGFDNINEKTKNVGGVAGNITKIMMEDVDDEQVRRNLESIPIKNEFIRNNALTICAVISLLFYLLPFIRITSEVSNDYTDASSEIKLTGFTTMMGTHGSVIGFLLLLGPILLIVMNYVVNLRPYRRMISVSVPVASIVIEIVVFLMITSVLKKGVSSVSAAGAAYDDYGDEIDTAIKVKANPQIGFYLILLSYIITGIIGYITYYGLKLSKKNK